MKAEIKTMAIGTVENQSPVGWEFDCKGIVAGIDITDDGILYAGYSIEELEEIAQSVQ